MFRARLLGLLLPLFVGCSSDIKIGTFNAEPAASITSPPDGSSVVALADIVLTGTVSDPDGAAQAMTVIWVRDGDEVCPDAEPDEIGNTSCITSFEEGGGTVTLKVRDAAGGSATDTIQLAVTEDASPTALIVSPMESGQYYSDQIITFEGELSDPEDAPELLTGVWESSLDGILALDQTPDTSGSLLDFATLSQGEHALVLTATDTVANSASDSLTIVVGPPNTAPSCEILAPASGSAGESGDMVQFEGIVTDPDIVASLIAVEWTSDKDRAPGQLDPDLIGRRGLFVQWAHRRGPRHHPDRHGRGGGGVHRPHHLHRGYRAEHHAHGTERRGHL
jgi:hypothetical protein